MPIEPPSLPTTSIRPDAFMDDPSLALQTISTEQAVNSLQSVNNFTQLLSGKAELLRKSIDAGRSLSGAMDAIRDQEVSDSQRVAAELQASLANQTEPANRAALQNFLASRGLPSDLSTSAARQAALNAVQNYSNQVRDRFETVDNPGIRARIASNADLGDAINLTNQVLETQTAGISPADLQNAIIGLGQAGASFKSALIDQLQQVQAIATTSVASSRLNTRLSNQLVQAIDQLRQASRSRTTDTERDALDQINGLNLIAQQVGSTSGIDLQSLNDQAITTLADQFSSQLSSIVVASLAAAPAGVADSYAAQDRANEAPTSITSSSTAQASIPRLRDPSQFI